jgi:hypothetical protein
VRQAKRPYSSIINKHSHLNMVRKQGMSAVAIVIRYIHYHTKTIASMCTRGRQHIERTTIDTWSATTSHIDLYRLLGEIYKPC